MAPSRHDWKIVDWDVKPQHNQPTNLLIQLHVTDANYSLKSMLILYDWPQWSFINTDIIENTLKDVSAHI